MTVAIAVDAVPRVFDDQDLLQPRPAVSRAQDRAGLVQLRFSQGRVEGVVKVENLGAQFAPPVEAAPLYRDTISTKRESRLDMVMLRGLSAYWAKAGFVATTMTFSPGWGAVPEAWRIEWTRVHGGEL